MADIVRAVATERTWAVASAGHESGSLLIVSRQKGTMFYAKFRDSAGRQRKPALGIAWVVPVGDPEASGRRNAGELGDWVDRRGTPPAGALTIRAAWGRLSEVKAEFEQRLLDEQRQQRQAAVREADERAGRTVADLAEAWLAWGSTDDPRTEKDAWKPSTARNYASYAKRLVRELDGQTLVSDVSHERLLGFLNTVQPRRNGADLDGGPSRKMLNLYAMALRGMFGWAVRNGWREDDPTVGLPTFKPRRKRASDPLRREQYLTPEEVRDLVSNLRAGPPPEQALSKRGAAPRDMREQDAAMVLLMAYTGLRPGEASALRWRDLDLDASVVRVVESRTHGVTGTPKSGSGRTVPLAPEAARDLAQLGLRENWTDPEDLVFVGRAGEHADLGALRDRFYDAQDRAGISPRRHLRQLRNSFGTICAAGGVPLRTLQEWLGHESIQTTEIYSSFMPRHQDAAMISAAFAPAD